MYNLSNEIFKQKEFGFGSIPGSATPEDFALLRQIRTIFDTEDAAIVGSTAKGKTKPGDLKMSKEEFK